MSGMNTTTSHPNSGLFDLTGKIALVTGSTRGLGLAIARGLGAAGARVILNGTKPAGLEAAMHALRAEGLDAGGRVFDVTDAEQVNAAVQDILGDDGRIDVLINNAGIQIRGPLEDFAPGDWRRIIEVNLTSAFLVARAAVKDMLARQAGKIINICSMQSELGRPGIAPYAASKGGLKMLTRAMAAEWGKHNIQVNGIGPGYFMTDMTKSLAADKKFDEWLRGRTPAGRWGRPEELVGPAIFLASAASSYVNGQILYVDGGMLASV